MNKVLRYLLALDIVLVLILSEFFTMRWIASLDLSIATKDVLVFGSFCITMLAFAGIFFDFEEKK